MAGEKEKIYIADKKTVDEILALLLSSELGLGVLKGLVLDSAGTAQGTSASIDALGAAVGMVKGYLEDNTDGLVAIRAAVEGKADEATALAAKALLENGTYGLNALKTAMTAGGVRTLKSVQRGMATGFVDSYVVDVKISPVDTSKAFVISHEIVIRNNTTVGDLAVTSYGYVPYLIDSETLRIFCSTKGNTSDVKATWQVVEFY